MLINECLIRNKNLKKKAVICGNDSITYDELHNRSIVIANELSTYTGDKVAMLLSNSIEYFVAFFGILYSGKTVVPIPASSKSIQINSIIKDCGIELLITHRNQAYCLPDVEVSSIIYVEDFANKNDICSYADLKSIDDDSRVAVILSTSSTSSNPKRVILTHKNIMSLISILTPIVSYNETSVSLIALPLTSVIMNSHFIHLIYLGATFVIMKEFFSTNGFFDLVEKERVTCFTCAPPMALLLARSNSAVSYDISSLRSVVIGGASISDKVLEDISNKYPDIYFSVGYGLTEACATIAFNTFSKESPHRNSVGKPIPGLIVRIESESREPLEPGNIGEIVVSGETIMSGYMNNPAETSRTIVNGFLRTGDMGMLDDEGYLYVVGRKKSMINSGGLSIFPEEIEDILLSCPAVADAVVYGYPDDFLEEVVAADIVLHEHSTKQDVLEFCNAKLPKQKVPRILNIVDNIDKTDTMKSKRR